MEARQLINGFIMKTTSNLAFRSYARQTSRQYHRFRPVTSTNPSITLSAPSKRSLTTTAPSGAPRSAASASTHSGSDNNSFPSLNNFTNTNSPTSSRNHNSRTGAPPEKLNEVDSILHSLSLGNIERKPAPQQPATTRNGAPNPYANTNSWGDINSMLHMFENASTSYGGVDSKKKKNVPELRLSPSLGRTVSVDQVRGFDAARAIGKLESLCAANKVRVQEREQRFHVRRGQLRKDLRSKRWRATFKFSFQKTVERCMQLRRQGW